MENKTSAKSLRHRLRPLEKASAGKKTGSPAEASAKMRKYLKYAIGEIVLYQLIFQMLYKYFRTKWL
jgi:hypothetical protein